MCCEPWSCICRGNKLRELVSLSRSSKSGPCTARAQEHAASHEPLAIAAIGCERARGGARALLGRERRGEGPSASPPTRVPATGVPREGERAVRSWLRRRLGGLVLRAGVDGRGLRWRLPPPRLGHPRLRRRARQAAVAGRGRRCPPAMAQSMSLISFVGAAVSQAGGMSPQRCVGVDHRL